MIFDEIEFASSLGLCAIASLPKGRSLPLAGRQGDFRTLGDLREALRRAKGRIPDQVSAAMEDDGVLADAVRVAEETQRQAARDGISIVTCFDLAFPGRLLRIPEAPHLLFVSGPVSILSADGIACVGTREPGPVGRAAGAKVVTALGEAGYAIVSGLARGVDTVAHEAALACGAPTIAVLAGWPSVEKAYPSENKGLARRIVDAGGALVSERMPWEKTQGFFFVERNRIQSGLSVGVLMIEAPVESGTMHTVRHGLAQGRAIMTIEPPAEFRSRPSSAGNVLISKASDTVALASALKASRKTMETVQASGPKPVFVVRGKEDYGAAVDFIREAVAPRSEERFTFFWKGVFSNWHMGTPFTVDDVTYLCGEQYMMAEKARLFGDDATLRKIMEATSPEAHKRLGRGVTPFDEEVWIANRREIVFRACVARTEQHAGLRHELLEADGTTLVEASPYDEIWGIALKATDPRAQDRSQWRGLNLLGEVWTDVLRHVKLRLDDVVETSSSPRRS